MDDHTDDASMEAPVAVDERNSSPPAAAARSRHLRTLMQSLTDSESSPAAASAVTATAAASTGTAEQTHAAPAPACWFTAPSGESIVSNKPFALELRLWLHHRSHAAAASASASAPSSSAAPSASAAPASASDRTLLLFPLAVKISARSVEKKTNIYQPLERVWVRAQREGEDPEEREESVSSPQSVKKDASSTESPARHPRAAHHVKAVQNGNLEAADDDEGGSDSDKDEERSDRSSIEPSHHSAKAEAPAAAAVSASSQLSLPFLPPAITSTLKLPLSKVQKAAKGPLFKPLYLKKGAANSKSAREEYRDRSIGTANIKTKRPLDVKTKATDLRAAELISQLHVSYAPLKREGDAGLLVHVLTKGGASEKRPRQKYVLFQSGFAYSIELPALPPSFSLTLHSFRLRSWEQQLASLDVHTEEAVLPPFPPPPKKRIRHAAAASPAVRSKFKVKAEQDSDGSDEEWLADEDQPRIERKLPSRTAAPRPAALTSVAAATTRSSASDIAGAAKRTKPQGLLGSLPTRHGRSLSALLDAIEQNEKREAGAKEPSSAAFAAATRRHHLQRSSAATMTSTSVDEGSDTDTSAVSRRSRAANGPGGITTEPETDTGWGTDDMQPRAKRQKIQTAIARETAPAAPVVVGPHDQASAASVAPAIHKKRHARRSLFSTKHQKQKQASATSTPASKRVRGAPPSRPQLDSKPTEAAAAAVADPSLSISNASTASFASPWLTSAWHLLPAAALPPAMHAMPFQQHPTGFQPMTLPLGMHCGGMSCGGGTQGANAGAAAPSAPWHASSIGSNGIGATNFMQPTGSFAAASLAAFSSRASSPAAFNATAASVSSHAFLRPPSATIMPLTPASPFNGGRMEESSSPAVPMTLSAGGSPLSPLQLTPLVDSAPHSGSTSGRCTPLPSSVAATAASGSPRSFFELSGSNHNSRQHAQRHVQLPLSGRTGSVALGSGAGLGFHAVHSPTQGQGRLGFQPRSLFLHPPAQASSRSGSGASSVGHMLLSPPMPLPLAALLGSSARDLHSPAPQSAAATAGSLQSCVTALELLPHRSRSTAAVETQDDLPLSSASDESVASDGEGSSGEENHPPPPLSQLSASIFQVSTPTAVATPFSPTQAFLRATSNSHSSL